MARVAKTVLEVGTHQSPDGPVVVTPERIRHWVRQNALMRAAGIVAPVPWGHQTQAVPGDPDSSQFLGSRFNAGYVDGLQATDGGRRLAFAATVPGVEADPDGHLVTWAKMPDGRQVKTAIKEVSAAIADKWRDGTGKVWNDVILHVALTPLPVWAGQDGFQRLGGGGAEGVRCLSLGAGQWKPQRGDAMADTIKTPDNPEGVEVGADAKPDAAPPAPPPAPAGNGMAGKLGPLLALLTDHGIVLPQDTSSPEELIERLATALTALKGRLTPDDGQDPNNAPPDGPVTEESPPNIAMMSLTVIKSNPALQKAVDRETERAQKDNAAAIDRLRKRGLPPPVVDELTGGVGMLRLSLTADGDPVEPRRFTVSNVLQLLERSLPEMPAAQLTQTLSAAAVVPSQDPRNSDEQAKVTKEMVAMALGKPTA